MRIRKQANNANIADGIEVMSTGFMTASTEGLGEGGKAKEGEVSAQKGKDDPVVVSLTRGVVSGQDDCFVFIGFDGEVRPTENKVRHIVAVWERAWEFLDSDKHYFVCADGEVVAIDATDETRSGTHLIR